MNKIYLAARYSRQEEMRGIRDGLQVLGFVVTSTWIDGKFTRTTDGLSVESPLPERTEAATNDWADLMAADVVISFTEPPRTNPGRGGRHVEFGAALALGKRCIIVGPRENVFHCMEGVTVVESAMDLFGVLSLAPPPPPATEPDPATVKQSLTTEAPFASDRPDREGRWEAQTLAAMRVKWTVKCVKGDLRVTGKSMDIPVTSKAFENLLWRYLAPLPAEGGEEVVG